MIMGHSACSLIFLLHCAGSSYYRYCLMSRKEGTFKKAVLELSCGICLRSSPETYAPCICLSFIRSISGLPCQLPMDCQTRIGSKQISGVTSPLWPKPWSLPSTPECPESHSSSPAQSTGSLPVHHPSSSVRRASPSRSARPTPATGSA